MQPLNIEILWLYPAHKKVLENIPVNKCFDLFFNLVCKSRLLYQVKSCFNNHILTY